jgi:hypothetical protein
MALDLPRRKFLTGLGSLFVVAPVIVHAGNIMPVKALDIGLDDLLFKTSERWNFGYVDGRVIAAWRDAIVTMHDSKLFASFPGFCDLTKIISDADSLIYREIDMLK